MGVDIEAAYSGHVMVDEEGALIHKEVSCSLSAALVYQNILKTTSHMTA